MGHDLDVAVVGAGIGGLAAATELRRAGLSVRVYESTHRVGGRMASFRHQGYTVDEGAEQLSAKGYRATWELLRRLDFPLSDVPKIGKAIAVWRNDRAQPGVSDPGGLLTGAGLSVRARLDLARFLVWTGRRHREFDADRPEHTPLGERTVAEYLRSRHPDLHDYLFQPVAGGFFGWDTARSAAAPFACLMREVGNASGWLTYADGMDTLARRLAERLDVRTGSEVHQVVAGPDSARLVLDEGTVTARSVLLCVPAPVAARIYVNPPAAEAEFLAACTFTPMLKVSCLLDRPLAPESSRPIYALLTPSAEDEVLSGLIIDHAKHPARAPAGAGLLSLMAAPGAIPGLFGASDADVIGRLTERAERYVPGLAMATRKNFVHRIRHGLPEATPAALRLRAGFAARPNGPVDYAGDWVLLRPSSEGAVRAAALAASRVLSRNVPVRAREAV
ncbi:FAD-dependent oxidoreductase [Amycolatopsis nigrescens]|uniref:FAD-dependent oxidoreductase n=1 Tax=Amycolatopsis nigrescens TaxID=381445 RepID=UPI00037D57E4|nr:FAD-dependent oxidoreductase [Amycolatopsis nigrescens]